MPLRAPSWTFLLLLLLLSWTTGCERDAGNVKPPPPAKPAAVVISADTAGWITPCGCASNQSGGMLRRGTFMADVRKRADAVYADAGGAAGGTSEYHRTKFEAILAGEMKLGLAAHNVGASEAALGAEYLRDAGKRLNAPFVSANVKDSAGGNVAEPLRVAKAGSRRVALTGVLSPKLAPPGLKVDDPRQAVVTAAAAAKGQYDSLVVLAYLPPDELEQLAAALPEADAVIGGPTRQPIQPRTIGPTLLASATNKGKFLLELSAGSSASNWSGKVVEMAATLGDETQQELNLKQYLAELGRRDFSAEQAGLVQPMPGAPADYRIAGSQACLECHKPDQNTWAHSKHSHAWETIQTKGFHVDSYCQQCHTTGYGLPGGSTSCAKTIDRVNVGCENCHGPSQAHVTNPKVRTSFVANESCIRCHDHENSPGFDYSVYWSRIQHGKGATATAPTTRP